MNIVAGNGQFRFSGDGGPATSATLDTPAGVVGDANGNIFVSEPPRESDSQDRSGSGTISVYAGNHGAGYSRRRQEICGRRGSLLSLANDDRQRRTARSRLQDALNGVIRSINSAGLIQAIVRHWRSRL